MRYSKNMNALNREENEDLRNRRVCIAGCGALGQYVFEMLGRLGVGNLTIIDSDIFDKTNLNRQLYSTVENIGSSKVGAAQKRMTQVNPEIKVNAIHARIMADNASILLQGHDVLVDALDNPASKILLQDIAEELKTPLVHGAISGWLGQVCTVMPGDNTLRAIYPQNTEQLDEEPGNPSFSPALVAAIQVSEVVKLLIGRGELLRHKLLYIDLLGQNIACLNLIS